MWDISHPAYYAVLWITYAVTVIIVALRVYTQHKRNRVAVDLSTICMLLGLLGQTVNAVGSTYTTFNRGDRNAANIATMLKVSFTTTLVNYFNKYILKFGFIAMYYRIFLRQRRGNSTAPWIRPLLLFITAYCLACFLISFLWNTFICSPISRNWSVDDYCTPIFNKPAYIAAIVMNVSSDLLIMIFPLMTFFALRLRSRADRFGFFFIIILGGISIAAALTRFLVYWVGSLQYIPSSAADDNEAHYIDPANTLLLTTGCAIEVAFGSIAACLPAFRAWWSWLLERRLKVDSGSRSEARNPSSGVSDTGLRDGSRDSFEKPSGEEVRKVET